MSKSELKRLAIQRAEGQSRLNDGLERTVYMPITACDKCPNQHAEKYYTGDSFEDVQEWKCEKAGFRRIALHEWNDQKPEIPEWCPLRPNAEVRGGGIVERRENERRKFDDTNRL